MTSAYPDIEGQLYTTTTPNATYTEAEARQRAASHREVAATASAAGASALTDAKAYTDQKVSPLATVASVVAGDLQALADAKTYTDAKVEDLGPGGGTYLDEAGQQHEFVFVMSDTDPGKTRTVNGKTVEVWWVQTTPPDPSAWYPKAPTFDLVAQTYTIPTDDGAAYSVHGVTTAAGTYRVTAPETVNINANPKSGYTFASDAEVAWSKVYEETPLAMDAAAAALGIPYYYRLDDPAAAAKTPPRNRGAASDNPLWGNANWLNMGATPAAGVGVTAFAPVSDVAAGLKDGEQLNALTVAAAVNVQGSTPGFMLTRDWNTKKEAWFLGLTPGIHHVAVTFDGTTKRTYLDGALRDETAEGLPTSAALRLFTPLSTTPTTSTFAGLVVDKSRALSAAQIKQLSDAVTR